MRSVAGPLDHIRVLELGSLIAGPFAGQLLGDYGAEVIKVEPPAGDPMRRWGMIHEGEGLWWTSIARNKRSVVLDLRTDEGAAPARRLADHGRRGARELPARASSSSGASATTTWWPTTPAS